MVALSVVVPMYNVERYLDECLRSLAAQTLHDLQVIMVDDGSPDASAVIAKQFADSDPRFRLVQQANAGLGAARNTGAAEATGEFLAFVDSDDVIPPYAFGALVRSLRDTGSDFATGNVHRLNELGTRQSPMHRRTFRTPGRRVHVRERDTLLVDRLATNKVWRRSFWDAHALRFPEGVLYEDISVVIPAHFLATAVDVLSAPVYLWRERPDDDASITQDRMREDALEDRFRAVRATSEFLGRNATAEDRRRWDRTALGSDLRIFLQVLDMADDAFRQRFLDLAASYLESVAPGVLWELPAIERLKWHLVQQRMLPQLIETITFNKSAEQRKAPAVRHGIRFYGDYPFKDDPELGIPREVYRLDKELRIRQKAEEVTWEGGKLVIRGRACLRFLRPNRRLQQHLRVSAVNPETGARVRLPVAVHQANEFRLPRDSATARRDWGGYEITIDPASLMLDGAWRAIEWYIELRVVNRGMTRIAHLDHPAAGAPQRPSPSQVASGVWIRPEWRHDNGLCLVVDPPAAQVTRHRVDDGVLELSGRLAEGTPGCAAVRLTRHPGDTSLDLALERESGGVFRARVPLEDLTAGFADRRAVAGGPGTAEQWDLRVLVHGEPGPGVSMADSAAEGRYATPDNEVTVERDKSGWAVVRAGVERPIITGVDWEGDLLHVRCDLRANDPGQVSFVVKANGRSEEHLFPLHRDGDRLRATLRPLGIDVFGQRIPLSVGGYRFRVRHHLGPNTWEDRDASVDHELVPALPISTELDGRAVSVDTVRHDVPVLHIGSALRPEDRGSYAQQLLREETYPKLRRKPIIPGLLFDSYTGKQYSDSPRGIYEELRHRNVDRPASWIVRDRQVALPDGLTEVPHASRQYFESLARSELIVTNAHLPMWFEKHPDQTVVQTWHGSMLKRIGFDIEHVQFASRNYYERLRHETNQWDYLVSPSPWATPILRRAFQFEGTILETGYPRNDIFHAPGRDTLTAEVRARLGLPEGKRVVLYAPTWRDDRFYEPGKYKLDLHLDLQRMYDALGEDHVLLVRRHPNIVDRVPTVGENFVFDVSTYPEIQELFLVTDVLVTDYSSLMFDFANTGRPMLFYTYDLDKYRDTLRGFYFDFEQTAPGPLLTTSDQVIEALRNIDETHAAHNGRYEAFVRQFCPLDDGKAAARVVDQLAAHVM